MCLHGCLSPVIPPDLSSRGRQTDDCTRAVAYDQPRLDLLLGATTADTDGLEFPSPELLHLNIEPICMCTWKRKLKPFFTGQLLKMSPVL